MVARSSATYKPSLDRLAVLVGRYFQIRDDYQNLMSDEVRSRIDSRGCELLTTLLQYTSNKGYCEDLDEGKYSLPLIHALQSKSLILQSLLSTRHIQGYLTREQKLIILNEMKTTGSLEFTRLVLDNLYQDLQSEIDTIGQGFGIGNVQLRQLIDLFRL